MLGRLKGFNVFVFFADGWEVYAEFILGEFLV
jgi:IS1 family transposase